MSELRYKFYQEMGGSVAPTNKRPAAQCKKPAASAAPETSLKFGQRPAKSFFGDSDDEEDDEGEESEEEAAPEDPELGTPWWSKLGR